MSTLNNYKPGYHELVAGYLVKKCGWTPTYADAVVADAIRFLSVCADHPEEHLVPSDDVDAVVDTIVLGNDREPVDPDPREIGR